MMATTATYAICDQPNGFGWPSATRQAIAPAVIGPTNGIVSRTPVMIPSSTLYGMPRIVRPIVVTVDMSTTRINCPRM